MRSSLVFLLSILLLGGGLAFAGGDGGRCGGGPCGCIGDGPVVKEDPAPEAGATGEEGEAGKTGDAPEKVEEAPARARVMLKAVPDGAKKMLHLNLGGDWESLPEGTRKMILESLKGAVDQAGMRKLLEALTKGQKDIQVETEGGVRVYMQGEDGGFRLRPQGGAPAACPHCGHRGSMAGRRGPMPGPRAGMRRGRGFPGVGRPDGFGRALLEALNGLREEIRGLRHDMMKMHAGHGAAASPGMPRFQTPGAGGVIVLPRPKHGAAPKAPEAPKPPTAIRIAPGGAGGAFFSGRKAEPALEKQVETLKGELETLKGRLAKLLDRLEKMESAKSANLKK